MMSLAHLREVLHKRQRQFCAGYALYGPSTMFVLTFGEQVTGVTCQHGTGDFLLTHPDMKVPTETSKFAISTSRYQYWDTSVRRYLMNVYRGKRVPVSGSSTCAGPPLWWLKFTPCLATSSTGSIKFHLQFLPNICAASCNFTSPQLAALSIFQDQPPRLPHTDFELTD